MSERKVGIGNGNSYLDIGIEPPIDDETAQAIIKKVKHDDFPEMFNPIFGPGIEQNLDASTPHTVISFDTGDSHRAYPGRFKAVAGEMAIRATRYLVSQGDKVTLLPEIVQIDFQTPIFGREADHQRELARHYAARQRLVL